MLYFVHFEDDYKVLCIQTVFKGTSHAFNDVNLPEPV